MPHEPYPVLAPLDPALYDLEEEDRTFLKAQTGIQDDAALRDHVFQVQAEAYAVTTYPCIRVFGFAKGMIAKHPAYHQVLELGSTRPRAIFLDIGCCMGSDVRKAIYDGFPRENVIASDIFPEFWTLGHKLFKTNKQTFPVPFLAGDILDEGFLSLTAPSNSLSTSPLPSLSALSSLTPLRHGLSVIHISMVFHLFEKDKQHTMANRLAFLLSPTPGSMIFGAHMGAEDTEANKEGGNRFSARGVWTFSHSPTSWKTLWMGEGGVFKSDEVTVTAITKEMPTGGMAHGEAAPPTLFMMYWSVTRK